MKFEAQIQFYIWDGNIYLDKFHICWLEIEQFGTIGKSIGNSDILKVNLKMNDMEEIFGIFKFKGNKP